MIDKLPNDVLLLNILSLLDGPTIIKLSLVCRNLNNLINADEIIWKKLCMNEFYISHDNAFRNYGWKSFYKALKLHTKPYIWGENFDGRLGLYHQEDQDLTDNNYIGRLLYPIHTRGPIQVTTPCNLSCLNNKSIIDIVVGGWSFHALDTSGAVWTWGAMQQGISSRFSIGSKRLLKPTLVESRIPFKSISSGRGHVIGLGIDGSVWHWTNHIWIQKVDINANVVQVVANMNYSSCLTDDGLIYIIPEPTYFTPSDSQQPEPTQIIASPIHAADLGLVDDKVVQIAGLDGFTLALTRFGKVFKLDTSNPHEFSKVQLDHFSSNHNEYNDRRSTMKRFITGSSNHFAVYNQDIVMLGTIHATKDTLPTRIPELDHQGICKITFGDFHFGALTNQGKVLTWGSHSSGALGQGKLANNRDYAPKFVESLNDKFVFALGFGGWQSAALAIDHVEIE